MIDDQIQMPDSDERLQWATSMINSRRSAPMSSSDEHFREHRQ